jgi:hypothetical protein
MDEDTGNGGLQRKVRALACEVLPLNSVHVLQGQLCFSGSKRGAGDEHNEVCEVCERGGELLCCDTCSLVFHLEVLSACKYPFPYSPLYIAVCLTKNEQIPQRKMELRFLPSRGKH